MTSQAAVRKRIYDIEGARQGPNLRALEFSPESNPLLEPRQIPIKKRWVSTGLRRDLADAQTGEISGAAVIKIVEERDDQDFVKVFADGVRAAFGLSKTAHRVFQLVLDAYQREPMSGGYSEAVYLAWFDGSLSGQSVDLSERTFQRGLRELLEKGFLAPKLPNMFWVNPSLFFKGDRVAFVREYRRRKVTGDAAERADLERRGQQRLAD